jgi:hypothetical protein
MEMVPIRNRDSGDDVRLDLFELKCHYISGAQLNVSGARVIFLTVMLTRYQMIFLPAY